LIDRNRHLYVRPAISAAIQDYEVKAAAGLLYQLAQHTTVSGVVSKKEMERLYDYHMARNGSVARAIYDEIMHWAVDGKCPYCEHRPVGSLDHFLPKSKYVSFAVSPSNLFGACNECNHIKGSRAPTSSTDLLLHPYFEDISASEWLVATVVESQPCAVTFSAVAPPAFSQTLKARLEHQFGLFNLSKLYTAQAAVEISEIRADMRLHFAEGGAVAVRRELNRQWVSRREHRVNSWRAALYKALSQSDWYCQGGFG
jgi:hypothetical protein